MFFENLIRKAKSDPQAFAKLYDLHISATYRYIEFRCKNQAEAEDLTSQLWETVLKNIRHLESDHEFAFKAWLYKIMRNILYQHFRSSSQKNTLSYEEQEDFLISPEDTPSETVQKQDEITQTKILIQALPEKQQEIILMRFSLDLKNKEIAKILGISEKTVASNFSRALETLKKNTQKLQ